MEWAEQLGARLTEGLNQGFAKLAKLIVAANSTTMVTTCTSGLGNSGVIKEADGEAVKVEGAVEENVKPDGVAVKVEGAVEENVKADEVAAI